MNRKKPIRFPDPKFYADYISLFRSLLDPGNWWCVLAQFEIFEQIWGTVKVSLKTKIPNVLHFMSTYYYMQPTCKKKKNACMHACMREAAGGAKLG